jgi:hypothetical protein
LSFNAEKIVKIGFLQDMFRVFVAHQNATKVACTIFGLTRISLSINVLHLSYNQAPANKSCTPPRKLVCTQPIAAGLLLSQGFRPRFHAPYN